MSRDFYVYSGKNSSGSKTLVAVISGGDERVTLPAINGGAYSVYNGALGGSADNSFVTNPTLARIGPRGIGGPGQGGGIFKPAKDFEIADDAAEGDSIIYVKPTDGQCPATGTTFDNLGTNPSPPPDMAFVEYVITLVEPSPDKDGNCVLKLDKPLNGPLNPSHLDIIRTKPIAIPRFVPGGDIPYYAGNGIDTDIIRF